MVGEKGTCLFIGKISLCEMSSRDGLDDEGCSHKKNGVMWGKFQNGWRGEGGTFVAAPLFSQYSPIQGATK